MAKKEKEPGTQCILRKNPTLLHKTNFQGSRKPEQQEVIKTLVKDTIERLSETQTKAAINPTEEDRGSVEDPVRDFTVDPVGRHSGQSTEGAQLQPQQNRDLLGGTESLPQCDVNAMEVDLSEVLDLCILDVVADQTTANRTDNLSDSISDSEIKVCVAVLKKQKERAELKVKLERLKRKKIGRFVGKQNQMGSNKHACQLSLERSKRVWDLNVYSTSS